MGNTQFKPGVSGNPGGRPKAIVDVRELAREQTKQNIATLIRWRDQELDPQVSLRAAVALHEIGWGKPGQAVHLNAGPGAHEICLKWIESEDAERDGQN